LRRAPVSARQFSQTQVRRSVVVRSSVLVLIAVSPSISGAPSTVGSRGDGNVSPELRLLTDESRPDDFRVLPESDRM
jgi:hypothetical protein